MDEFIRDINAYKYSLFIQSSFKGTFEEFSNLSKKAILETVSYDQLIALIPQTTKKTLVKSKSPVEFAGALIKLGFTFSEVFKVLNNHFRKVAVSNCKSYESKVKPIYKLVNGVKTQTGHSKIDFSRKDISNMIHDAVRIYGLKFEKVDKD